MPDLRTLSTPALVVDALRLTRNAERMQARADESGVRLRPHLKTVKSAAIAARVVTGGGATVSTLREAEYFAEHGIDDLVWAACATPDKLDRAAALVERDVRLRLIVDDAMTARAVAAHPTRLEALVEVDCGEHRTGVLPDDDGLLEVATALGDRCAGVLTHAGHSYECRTPAEIAKVAEQERSAAVGAAERLRRAGWACPIVSVGSTPTAVHAARFDGVTEMRPGVYLFGDLFQVAIGCCAFEDIAASVLATVISRRGDRVVIDAGGLALSKDRSTAITESDAGYGVLLDVEGRAFDVRACVDEVHQEHGIVRRGPPSLKVGDRVRVLPNHACMTAAAYDRYHVVEGDVDVRAEWGRCNGW